MNICSKTGEVKMPLLTEDWSSYFTLYIIIDMIDTLLVEPQQDERYRANQKTQQYQQKQLSQIKQNKRDKVIQFSIRNSNKSSLPDSEQEELERSRPIQTMKNKLKRMKTIILEKADDNSQTEQQLIGGTRGKNDYQRIQLTKNNKLSKISEQCNMQNSRVHIKSNQQLNQSQESPRATVKATQASKNTFFIPRSYSKHIIESQEGFLSRSKNMQILQKTKNTHSKQFKKDKIRIPTLKKNSIEQELIEVLHKDIMNTTTLEQNHHQLQKINKMLNTFQSEYEELMARKTKTKCSQLAQIIEEKMRLQLAMIEELNQLSLFVKRKMVKDVKSYVTK